MNTQKRNLCAAGVLLTAAATMVVLFLFRLSQPDKAQQSIFLNCTASDRGGWTFYTEAGQTEPVFGFGGYIDGVPAEGAGPVVAERIMEEPGERCFLQFSCANAGLQVFLEDILLYTDFPQQENRVDVFLQNADFAGINYNGLCIPLPLDCAGKALRIVTYGPSLNGLRVPVFPSQASRFSDAVVQTTGVVWCMTAVTVRLMLALSLLLVLVLGAQAGQPLWKLLPLSGYFLLAAVSGVCNPFLESASGLNAASGLLNWVYLIHMDFLYIYLAAELRGKKRWGLAATALLHILLTALQSFAAVPLLIEKVGDWLGFSLLVVAIVLMLFSHEEMQRRISWCLCAVAAFLFLIWGVTRYVGVEVLYPFSNPVTSMLGGYPHAFYALLCNVAGLLCAVQVVVEFVRSMLLRQRQMHRYNKRLAARMKGHCGRAVVQPQIGCNCLFQLSRLNRLEQVLDRADAVAVLEKFRRACDKQDAGFVVALPQFLRQFHAAFSAHQNIQTKQRKFFSCQERIFQFFGR